MDDKYEQILEFFHRYFKAFLVAFAILIVLIIFLLLGNNKYKKYEKQMITKSKSYLSESYNYVTLEKMKLSYSGCASYSGVYYNRGNYTPYLFCDDYNSIKLEGKKIKLNGYNPTIINLNEEYIDQGYNSNYEVEVINTVKNDPGVYFVTYIARENGKRVEELRRIVIVKDGESNNFSLLGDKEINIFKGEKYVEPGYNAFDNNGNRINQLVTVSNNININKPGTYEIIYTLNYNNKKFELKRKVNVLDVEIYYELESEKPKTNGNKVHFIITGKDYMYTLLYDGSKKVEKEFTVPIYNNGTYNFKIFAKDKFILKTVVVNNIYSELNASCTITQGNNQIFVNVVTSGGYGDLSFSYLDGDTYSSFTKEKIYYFKNKTNSTTVKIKDAIDNIKTITCSNSSININTSSLEIHFIASGHYDDSILIRTDDKTIYIDGGRPSCASKDIKYLNELGVSKIDYMIGSHVEYDHTEAQADILDTFQVDRILYPVDIYTCNSTKQCKDEADTALVLASLRRNNKKAETISIPSLLKIGDMTLYFLAPWDRVQNNNNNNSFIFILKYRNNSFMFTGDSGSPFNRVETLISNANKLGLNNINVDLLKYPHHGNATMYIDTLRAINPKIVVVPNYNASKYPNEANKETIKNYGAKLYRQSDSSTGNITIISDGNNINVYMNSQASTYKK